VKKNWEALITEDDLVLIAGDISWAMHPEEAHIDLEWIHALPGTKVLIRGNHDYWWNGISKVRSALPPNCIAIQNDAFVFQDYAICGTRGWILPGHPKFTADDETIYLREIGRLKMSLERAASSDKPIIAMLHYPPCGQDGEDTGFTKLLEEYAVKVCVYGHLHGAAHRFAFEGVKNGVKYQLVSADYVNFCPVVVVP